MALILNIESTTTMCSIALGENGELRAFEEYNEGFSHAEKLAPFIHEVLAKQDLSPVELDAIAVSKGPGSYTGLRIGVSIAKGLSYALNKPLIAIPTLKHMCFNQFVMAEQKRLGEVLLCPMLDARRMEVYCAIYDSEINQVQEIQAKVLDPSSFIEVLQDHRVIFFGTGVDKFQEICSSSNTYFVKDVWPSAVNMLPIAEKKFLDGKFEDVAYFEPFYLKDFIATKPKRP